MQRSVIALAFAVTSCLPGLSATAARPPQDAADPGIRWRLMPAEIRTSCDAAIATARTRIAAIAKPRSNESAMARLAAIDQAVAAMNDALVAQKLLADVAEDDAVRAASAACNAALDGFRVDLAADASIYALAAAARREATRDVDRQLAERYAETGRHAGGELDAAGRAEVAALRKRLDRLQIDFQQALAADRTTVAISAAEAASLPHDFLATLTKTADGYTVPVDLRTHEPFMRSEASGAARERFERAFLKRGGAANAQRVREAVALRQRIAHMLGYASWADCRLDERMAKTPARALALLREVDARLLPKARAEIAALAALKARSGDATPFASWDYPYFEAQLEKTRYDVDAEAVNQYFPVEAVVPAVLALYQHLLGVDFRRIEPADAWAPGVQQYRIVDHATGRPIGVFFLDLAPRPGKYLRPAQFTLRAGHALADGGYRLPIAAVIGNGPAAAPGRPAVFSHRGVIEFFHEFGHLMHATLSTAPYATLQGTNVREDFVEAPSQMLENWMWQPSVLKAVSHHVDTGKPLPDALIARMIALKHAADGVFWTRQAFLGVYDLTLHGAGGDTDPDRLWFALMPTLTPLPAAPGTLPAASFMPIMGGYDAGYYGYLWSRVYAQDMFTAFQRDGIDNPAVGLRYRRTILEPGGSAEPDTLVRAFLGRPVSPAAFYRDLGLAP